MPKIVRMYIIHVLIGFALAALFVAMLLWFNVANLWHLVSHSDKGILAVVMLWIANGIVFAGAQFAIAVMNMKDDDDDDAPRGGHRQRVSRPQSALQPALARGRSAQKPSPF